MANFASIRNLVESLIANQISAARSNQGAWEWFSALEHITSAQRFTGTPKVYGLTQLSSGANVVETAAVTLFGLLIDNSMSAEDLYVAVSDVASTPGTTNTLGYYYAPRGAITQYVLPNGLSFSSRFELFSVLGTEAGLEAGTASTTQPSVIAVYTK